MTDYKRRPNVAGGRETCAPEDVPREMGRLLSAYEARDEVSFADIVGFHHDLERIHPFQDGNGRVGRLVAFKECLRHGHVPFLIEDSKKAFYYRGLARWESEPGYLLDTCLDSQDSVAALMGAFRIPPLRLAVRRGLRQRDGRVRGPGFHTTPQCAAGIPGVSAAP
ncbi:hypothetical protein E5335_07695 [Coriobacteriaceae bacterium]|nr:hypothetical protein E5335_07695 [Coriobacteriaceae bacterium]